METERQKGTHAEIARLEKEMSKLERANRAVAQVAREAHQRAEQAERRANSAEAQLRDEAPALDDLHPNHERRAAVFAFPSMIKREHYRSEEAYLDARHWEVEYAGSLLRDLLGRAFLAAAKELSGGIDFGDPRDPNSNRGRVNAAFELIYDMLYGV